MWYFTYDHRSAWREMMRVYRDVPPRVPLPLSRRAAVLRNFRICFPAFSEEWSGGVASIVEAPGKTVSGALFDLPRPVIQQLDIMYKRAADQLVGEHAETKRIEVEVFPFEQGPRFLAVTHQAIAAPGSHYAPSAGYLDMLVYAAAELGLSSLWMEQLRSFVRSEWLCRIPA